MKEAKEMAQSATPSKGEIVAAETRSLVSCVSPAKYFFNGLVGYAGDVLVFTVSTVMTVLLWVLRLPIRLIQWYFTPVKVGKYSEDSLISYNIIISVIESFFVFSFFCYLFRETLNTYAQKNLQVIFLGFILTFIGLITSKIIYNGVIWNNDSDCLSLGSMLRKLWQALVDKCVARGKQREIEGK